LTVVRLQYHRPPERQPWTSKQDIDAAEQLLAIWADGTNLWTVSAQGNIFRYQ